MLMPNGGVHYKVTKKIRNPKTFAIKYTLHYIILRYITLHYCT